MKKQDIKIIHEMLQQGKNSTEISLAVGIPSSTIRAHVRRHPELWPSHGSTLWPEGKTFLLRQMPYGMVEQPPGASSEENLLPTNL